MKDWLNFRRSLVTRLGLDIVLVDFFLLVFASRYLHSLFFISDIASLVNPISELVYSHRHFAMSLLCMWLRTPGLELVPVSYRI